MTVKASNMVYSRTCRLPAKETNCAVVVDQYAHGDSSPAAAGQLASSAGVWTVQQEMLRAWYMRSPRPLQLLRLVHGIAVNSGMKTELDSSTAKSRLMIN